MKNAFLFLALLFLEQGVQAQNWYQIPLSTTKQLNTIDFPSESVGYIGGNDSLLLKSTDGGQTWQELAYSGVTFFQGGEQIVQLDFISEDVGFMAVGPYSGVYKTVDGGVTWQGITVSGNLCYTRALYFYDDQTGFIGGSGCFQGELINSMNAGTCSEAQVPVTYYPEQQVSGFDFRGTLGLASSYGSRILRSTDSGNTWDTIPVHLSPGDTLLLNAVKIMDDTLCYAVYSSSENATGFGIIRSTDAGLNWDTDPNAMTFFYPDMMDVCTTGNNKLIICGKPGWQEEGLIFEISSNGFMNPVSLDYPLRSCAAYGDSVAFAVGENGYLVTNAAFAQLGLEANGVSSQWIHVYPNPSDGVIFLEGLSTENTTYAITTLSGGVVETGVLEASKLDISHLSSGIYLLNLETIDQHLITRIVRK